MQEVPERRPRIGGNKWRVITFVHAPRMSRPQWARTTIGQDSMDTIQ